MPFTGYGLGAFFCFYYQTYYDEWTRWEPKIIQIADGDYQWVYLSAFVFSIMSNSLNNYPTVHKMKIMTYNSSNLRSNMFIYKLAAEGSPESRVILSTDGDEGRYNRANRSLYHFLENSMPMIFGIALNSWVFPRIVFYLTMLMFVGRFFYTQQITRHGFGLHRAAFYMIIISHYMLGGMTIIISV